MSEIGKAPQSKTSMPWNRIGATGMNSPLAGSASPFTFFSSKDEVDVHGKTSSLEEGVELTASLSLSTDKTGFAVFEKLQSFKLKEISTQEIFSFLSEKIRDKIGSDDSYPISKQLSELSHFEVFVLYFIILSVSDVDLRSEEKWSEQFAKKTQEATQKKREEQEAISPVYSPLCHSMASHLRLLFSARSAKEEGFVQEKLFIKAISDEIHPKQASPIQKSTLQKQDLQDDPVSISLLRDFFLGHDKRYFYFFISDFVKCVDKYDSALGGLFRDSDYLQGDLGGTISYLKDSSFLDCLRGLSKDFMACFVKINGMYGSYDAINRTKLLFQYIDSQDIKYHLLHASFSGSGFYKLLDGINFEGGDHYKWQFFRAYRCFFPYLNESDFLDLLRNSERMKITKKDLIEHYHVQSIEGFQKIIAFVLESKNFSTQTEQDRVIDVFFGRAGAFFGYNYSYVIGEYMRNKDPRFAEYQKNIGDAYVGMATLLLKEKKRPLAEAVTLIFKMGAETIEHYLAEEQCQSIVDAIVSYDFKFSRRTFDPDGKEGDTQRKFLLAMLKRKENFC